MKKITLIVVVILAFSTTSFGQSPCTYSILLQDSWGDGWNGATIDVLVDGVVVLDDITFTTGFDESFDLTNPVSDGQIITAIFDGANGSNNNECSYQILNNLGAQVGSGDSATDTDPVTVACQEQPDPPTNVSCATAAAIQCGETLMTNSIGSNATSEDSGCSIGDNGVWYSFVGTGFEVTLTSTAGFDHAMAIASGSCGALVNIGCDDGSLGTETFTFTSVLNEPYYVYIAHYAAGNTSTGEISLNLECSTCNEATVTYDIINDCETSGGFLIDVTVSDLGSATALTLTNDQNVQSFPVTAAGTTVQFGPFVNGTEVVVTSNDDNDDDTCTVVSQSLTQVACPPANDECTDAVALTVNVGSTCTNVTAGTTTASTASSQADDVSGTPNNDVWYSFTATSSSHEISLLNRTNDGSGTSSSIDMGIGVYDVSAGCDALVFSSTSDPEIYTATGLTIGTNYVVRVYGWFSSVQNINFDICVGTPPPANDECSVATLVNFGSEVTGNNSGATDSMIGGTDCFTGNIRDVWYAVTADATGAIYVNGLTAGFQYGIYSDCMGTQVGNCNEGATGLTDGTTYYIRINDDGTGTTRASGAFSYTPSTVALSSNDFDSETGFTYYPNPVKNTLTLNSQQNIDAVVMYNMLGQEVLRLAPNSVNTEVDMSNLSNGAYFAKVSILGNTETIRLIKQ